MKTEQKTQSNNITSVENIHPRNVNREHKESLTKLEKVAVFITDHVGTIEFAIFCVILVSIPLVWKTAMSTVLYISSGYLQLVLLPLIMIGQNLQNRHSERRAEADYQVDVKDEHQVEMILRKLEDQDQKIMKILNQLGEKE